MTYDATDDYETKVKPFLEQIAAKHGVSLQAGLDAYDGMIRALRNEALTDQLLAVLRVPLRAFLREKESRALLDQLITATGLYSNGPAVKELMDFIARQRYIAPFNAALLQAQKPGLTHAASASDWAVRFHRRPKMGARPLIIMRPKGPVDFVFDVIDTEGAPLPEHAFAFPTLGAVTRLDFEAILVRVRKDHVAVESQDAGDGSAGWIRWVSKGPTEKAKQRYEMAYNVNHPIATSVVTVAHELAHLYLGHLGADSGREVPDRRATPLALREVEAEMTAYLVAKRNGLTPRSESYLDGYKGAFAELQIYHILRATNSVETVMGVSAQNRWNKAGPV